MVSFTYDFFVSRRGPMAEVAQEVADVLRGAGHSVFVQDDDIVAGDDFVEKMCDALEETRHIVVLLSADYQTNFYTKKELSIFTDLAAESNGLRRPIVLRVEDCAPVGPIRTTVYQDLFGLTDPKARRSCILDAVEGCTAGRARRSAAHSAPPASPAPRGAVPPADAHFTGRRAEMERLAAFFECERRATITQAAVHGLGGVGKSRLAAEYAHAHGEDYAVVWWASAETRTLLTGSLFALAAHLDTRLAGEQDREKAAREALALLERSPRRSLLVYDNVETPDAIADWLPGGNVDLIVTTRFPDWGGTAESVEIEVLPAPEAATFLRRRAGREVKGDDEGDENDDGAAALAEVLGCLPLALDHAAAYCRRSGMGFRDYAAQATTLIDRAPRAAGYPNSVAATFDLAMTSAEAQAPGARRLMAFLASLAPEPVPLDLLDGFMEPRERAEAVMALVEVSLLKHVAAEGTPAVLAHRLVLAAAASPADPLHDVALERVAHCFPINVFHQREEAGTCVALLPHALRLLSGEEARKAQDTGKRRDRRHLQGLLNAVGLYLHWSGAYEEAVLHLRRSLELASRLHGPHSRTAVRTTSDLAHLFLDMNRLEEAGPLFRQATAAARRAAGDGKAKKGAQNKKGKKKRVLYGEQLNKMGYFMLHIGRYKRARVLLQRAIAVGEKTIGRSHADMAMRLNNLALVHHRTGNHEEARPLFEEALEITRNMPRPDPKVVSLRLNNLGHCLHMLGRCEEAESHYRESIAIGEGALGADHPALAKRTLNLAHLLRETGRSEEAEEQFKRSMALLEDARKVDDPWYALVLAGYARQCLENERLVEASIHARRALQRLPDAFDIHHRWRQEAASVMADVLEAIGKGSEARDVRIEHRLEMRDAVPA